LWFKPREFICVSRRKELEKYDYVLVLWSENVFCDKICC